MAFSMSSSHQIYNSSLESLHRNQELSSPIIVIAVHPFRESDLIARLLTPTFGKISAIGRHARGSKKRFPSSIDVFDRGVARLTREKNGGLGLKEFSPSHSLSNLRIDLDKLSAASLLCECVDRIVQEDTGEDPRDTFELIDLTLNAIDEAEDLRPILRATLVALTSLLKIEGVVDLTNHPVSKHTLMTGIHAVESFSERKLLTRSVIEPLLDRLSKG